MSYGFFMAPIQFKWFGFLSRAFPLTKKNPTIPALKRVAVDQFLFAPFGMAIYGLQTTYEMLTAVQGWCVFSHS